MYTDICLCQNMRNNKNEHSGRVSNFSTELWPLIDVKISFFLNIFLEIMNGF